SAADRLPEFEDAPYPAASHLWTVRRKFGPEFFPSVFQGGFRVLSPSPEVRKSPSLRFSPSLRETPAPACVQIFQGPFCRSPWTGPARASSHRARSAHRRQISFRS